MRIVGGAAAVIGLGSAAFVLALTGRSGPATTDPDAVAVPAELAGYSHLTGRVSDSAPGAAVALYQHGFGVELLDSPQAVVLGAGGDTYRRVDVAERRAGAETQGDPAPMLLSPDGTKVAVGDHDTDRPDVVVVDLVTGETTEHALPAGRSVVPVAWSSDGRTVAHLLSPEPTSPYSGGRITGDVGLLDLSDDSTTVLEERTAVAAAFSPDGSELAVERTGTAARISVVDLGTEARRDVEADGVLAGPAAWSPDGRLLATTTTRPDPGAPGEPPGRPTGLTFVDVADAGAEVPAPLPLSLAGPGRVLGWSGPEEVVVLLDTENDDPCCGSDTLTLSGVPLDGSAPAPLMRLTDLGSFGVGRFQLASATVDDLRVVRPTEVDRGPWPLALRGCLVLLVGLVAWLVARSALRRRSRRGSTRHPSPSPRPATDVRQLTDQRR
ncbi:hypothetical protein SFC79_14215 [Nocardioides sp. S-58]|uniref:WD40 repeat protein n=1 Tax=Nocardioides renjunii TaxID=3095075 RepID=A0ABU5KDB7_9ACTN|nr:hypothetical protein [Nocardioides sp. S-58]MDZ5662927.1 hypothetical protein [Nocardioides sp. S-58]